MINGALVWPHYNGLFCQKDFVQATINTATFIVQLLIYMCLLK